jgi:hypothetical protein
MTQDAAIVSMPLQDAARPQAQLGAPLPVLFPTGDNRCHACKDSSPYPS